MASYSLLLTYSYFVHAQIRVGAVDVGVESGPRGDPVKIARKKESCFLFKIVELC